MLIVAVTGTVAADIAGFHSTPTDRMVGYIGLMGEGQSISFGTGSTKSVVNMSEMGVSLGSLQVLGDGGAGLLNFFAQESFGYMFGGSLSKDNVAVTVDDAAGYFAGILLGASTNLPTFVENLEIMVGLGYHMDCGYLALLAVPQSQSALLIDASLVGVGLSLAVDYTIGEIGFTLVSDLTCDLWGFSLPIGGIIESVDGQYSNNPSFNFGVALGVSIPNDVWEDVNY